MMVFGGLRRILRASNTTVYGIAPVGAAPRRDKRTDYIHKFQVLPDL